MGCSDKVKRIDHKKFTVKLRKLKLWVPSKILGETLEICLGIYIYIFL